MPPRKRPLERGAPLTRTARLRPKGGSRFKGKRDDAYRMFVRSQPCLIGIFCLGVVEAHHVKTRGAGGADRDNLLALCGRHHSEWHTIGRRSFERRWGLDAAAEAVELGQRYAALRAAARVPRQETQE